MVGGCGVVGLFAAELFSSADAPAKTCGATLHITGHHSSIAIPSKEEQSERVTSASLIRELGYNEFFAILLQASCSGSRRTRHTALYCFGYCPSGKRGKKITPAKLLLE